MPVLLVLLLVAAHCGESPAAVRCSEEMIGNEVLPVSGISDSSQRRGEMLPPLRGAFTNFHRYITDLVGQVIQAPNNIPMEVCHV